MNRQQTIQKYFQKKDLLTVKNKKYQKCLTGLFQWLVKTDEVKNDITINTLDLKKDITATIIAKQDGVIAGIEEIVFLINSFTLRSLGEKGPISLISPIHDGNFVKSGQSTMKISGSARTVLAYERIILNILGRMSGIATQTNHLVKKIHNIPNTPKIAATRKTPWMSLDKKAVAIGGGLTHRLNLSDEILIKDNHLAALKEKRVEYVVEKMCKDQKEYFEIEVENISQAKAALKVFSTYYSILTTNYCALALLLDNWSSSSAKRFIDKVKKTDIYSHVILEASGNITEENIVDWTKTGVDIISLGSLTHSAKNFNLSMKID